MTETCSNATAKPNIGEVAYGYWETLCAALDSIGINRTSSLMNSGAVTVERYISEFEKGLQCDANFGLRLGSSVSLKTFPVLGMTLLSCDNLQQALTQIIRYESLNHDLGMSTMRSNERESVFCWTPNPRFFPEEASFLNFQLTLSVFAGIKTFSPFLLQKSLSLSSINFIFSSVNALAQKELHDYFGCPIRFGATENAMLVDPEVLTWQIAFSDPATFSALTAHADTLLFREDDLPPDKSMNNRWSHTVNAPNASEDTQRSSEFEKRVKKVIPAALRQQSFRLEDVAALLNLSPRSLQRKLKHEGYTYQRLLDETRLKLARNYLQEDKLTMSEIAFLIGYQEQSSFNHAFKNWTGLTPGEFRGRGLQTGSQLQI